MSSFVGGRLILCFLLLLSVFKVEYSNDYPNLSITQAANTPRCSMENYQTRFFLPIINNDKD
jgi:hypothetical protein